MQQGRCFHCAVEVAKILCKSTFYRTNTWIVDWNKMAFMVKDPLPKESELDEEEKEILREMREEAPDLFMVPLDEVRIGDWDCEEEDYDA